MGRKTVDMSNELIGYRLGDAVRLPCKDCRGIPLYRHHTDKWPESLAARYHKGHEPVCGGKIRALWGRMRGIDKHRLRKLAAGTPLPAAVARPYSAVHLRTGDVMDSYDPQTEKNSRGKSRFVSPSRYSRVARRLRSMGYSRVWLVTGSHNPSDKRQRKSAAYVRAYRRGEGSQSLRRSRTRTKSSARGRERTIDRASTKSAASSSRSSSPSSLPSFSPAISNKK